MVSNPYEPPLARSEPALTVGAQDLVRWRDDVRRGATLVLVMDSGRALLWRTTAAFSMAYPSESPALLGAHGFNISVKLVGAVGIAAATVVLTRPSRAGARMRAATWARAFAALGVAAHAIRLVLQLVGADGAVGVLEPLTTSIDGVTIASCAFCVASFFRAAGMQAASSLARLLASGYLVASASSAWISAVAIPSFPRAFAAPSGFRAVLSLVFVGLAVGAIALIRRVRDVARSTSTDRAPNAPAT